MKILAIDIGAGTEDILLYDDQKQSVENCMKIITHTPYHRKFSLSHPMVQANQEK
jgi:uncharacterized protein (DUF1786 family)